MSRVAWTESIVSEERARIRQHFLRWREIGGDEQALREIVDLLSKANLKASKGRLQAYLLGMFGLIAHRDSGLLTGAQYERLVEHCLGALNLQKIDPARSILAYMYSDVHALIGQIAINAGNHWGGMWHQLCGSRHLRDADEQSTHFHSLTLAQRLLRIGHIQESARVLDEVLKSANASQISSSVYSSMVLNRLTIHRLNREFSEAHDLSLRAIADSRLTKTAFLHIQWEELCRKVIEIRDFTEIHKAIDKGGTHHSPFYLILAVLWDAAIGEGNLARPQSSLERVSARRRKVFKVYGRVFDFVEALHVFNDEQMPPHVRLEHLGRSLSEIHSVFALDEELLIWLGASRVLKRANFAKFAAPCFLEYQLLSLRISKGKCDDLLHCNSEKLRKISLL